MILFFYKNAISGGIMKTKRKLLIYLIMFFAGIGGVLYGYDIGVISGALLFMKGEIALTHNQLSLIVAAVLGGGAIATLIAGPLSDIWGRKFMIILSGFTIIIGTLVVISSHSFLSILTGRLIQGISIGIITIVIPLYLSETAPAHIRGRSIATFQLFLTGGILLAYVIDMLFEKTGSWRGMFSCLFIPGSLFLLGSFLLPESPVWLLTKNKISKTKQTLLLFKTAEEADNEIEEMQKLKDKTLQNKKRWQPYYALPLFLAISIAILNQLTGINSLLQFSTYILKESGVQSNIISMLGSTNVGLINFLMTIISIFLIDRLGRKPLLTIGTLGVTLSLIALGVISFFLPTSELKGSLLIIGLTFFILFFAIGPGVVVWLAVSELLPMNIRGKAMSFSLFLNSLASTILASAFLAIVSKIGYSGAFWMCAFFSFIYFLIAFFLLPETKDKTLEEIEHYFRKSQ
jgi:sugar porter (SP) family MFS transporter